jgi:hypothetical protein
MMYADPFYRITYLIKEEIRKYKWIEGEKGRALSWPEARAEWTKAHREQYEKFLVETLSFPTLIPATACAREASLLPFRCQGFGRTRTETFCRCGDFSSRFLFGKDSTPRTAQASLDQSAGVLFEALLHRVCLKLCLNASP